MHCMQCVTKIFLNMHDWNIHSLDIVWDDVYFWDVFGCWVSLHTDWALRDMCMWTVVIFTPWLICFILEWNAFFWSGGEWDGLVVELPLWLKVKEKKVIFRNYKEGGNKTKKHIVILSICACFITLDTAVCQLLVQQYNISPNAIMDAQSVTYSICHDVLIKFDQTPVAKAIWST